MTQGKETVKTEPLAGKVRFEYIKSNFFRVIHVSGAHGGMIPAGRMIHMALFNERHPIPKAEEYEAVGGRLGEATKKEVRQAIVREVEVDVIMDLNTARSIRDWLDKMVVVLESTAETLKHMEEK